MNNKTSYENVEDRNELFSLYFAHTKRLEDEALKRQEDALKQEEPLNLKDAD
jgi:hypothetical protein